MNILVTAGSTWVPIDKVRGISNLFRGRTGTEIAITAMDHGHQVTLLTSNPGTQRLQNAYRAPKVRAFRTFDDLALLLEEEVRQGGYDAIIHSAAVSDYIVSRVLYVDEAGAEHTIDPREAGSKISSSYRRLRLELAPTMKLIDQIREPWGFQGTLVKFKLQVDMDDEELLAIARKSRVASRADFIVANTFERKDEGAYIVSAEESAYVTRDALAGELLRRIT